MHWQEITSNADDCDALYDSGIARVGSSVYIRLAGVTTRSDHDSEDDAQWAYIEAQPVT